MARPVMAAIPLGVAEQAPVRARVQLVTVAKTQEAEQAPVRARVQLVTVATTQEVAPMVQGMDQPETAGTTAILATVRPPRPVAPIAAQPNGATPQRLDATPSAIA